MLTYYNVVVFCTRAQINIFLRFSFRYFSALRSSAGGAGHVHQVLRVEIRGVGQQSYRGRGRCCRFGHHRHRRSGVRRVVFRMLRSYPGEPLHDHTGELYILFCRIGKRTRGTERACDETVLYCKWNPSKKPTPNKPRRLYIFCNGNRI